MEPVIEHLDAWESAVAPGGDALAELGIDGALLEHALREHASVRLPALRRFWSYYRNPAEPISRVDAHGGASVRRRLAQEAGLPPRLREGSPSGDDRASARREVVIENDIAWRVDAMVDFMFGKPVVLVSTAPEERTRRLIERVLDAVWEASGGIALLQDMAMLGHVYGFVDLVLRVDERLAGVVASGNGLDRSDEERVIDLARRMLRVEVVEPTRSVPIQDPSDYRRLRGLAIHTERTLNELRPRTLGEIARGAGPERRRSVTTEVLTPFRRRVV